VIHWSADDWRSASDVEARDTDLGVYVADLPTGGLVAGTRISFTFYWQSSGKWEGVDFAVRIIEPDRSPTF
jgi:hypothetical protein